MTVPGGATDSIFYDLLGNIEHTKTPLGWITYFANDRVGRTTRVRTPVNAAQTLFREDSTYYNRRGLAYRTVSYGPAMSYTSPTWNVAAQKVIAQQTYNDEGQLTRVDRRASPDTTKVVSTQWVYDVAGRQTVEIDAVGFRDSASYDPAGNVVRQVSRRRAGVPPTDIVYDRLNRPRRRIMKEFLYPKRTNWPGLMVLDAEFTDSTNQPFNQAYPWFPSEPDGRLKIPEDTATFAYDAVGNLIVANNRWARIKRTYSLDQLIETDSLRIRNYGDTAFSHAYGVSYTYDLNRRLLSVAHPAQLAPAGSSGKATVYQYDSLSGDLTTVTDVLGNAFQFTYTTRGDRIRAQLPGSIVDSAWFDLDGRLVGERFKNYNTTSPWHFTGSDFRNDALTYADPTRIATSVSSIGYHENTRSRYTGLGHLSWLTSSSYGSIAGTGTLLTDLETFTPDALGNTLMSRDSATIEAEYDWSHPTVNNRTWSYDAVSGRLTLVADTLANLYAYRHDSFYYDEAGNLEIRNVPAVNTDEQPVFEELASYYGADNRLRFAESRRLKMTAPSPGCKDQFGNVIAFCWESSWPWLVSFEEYRYDALGRRVLVMNRQDCGNYAQVSLMYCNIGTIRRTVWDGNSELYEIQQYGGSSSTLASAQQLENDTSTTVSFVAPGTFPIAWDPNPQFGRVGYTNGPSIDHPLGAIRTALVDTAFSGSDRARHLWAPFTIVPHWTWRGRADYGTLGDGGTNLCWTSTSSRCIGLVWRAQPFVFALTDPDTSTRWFGSVLGMKRDASGLHFHRNRYLDPATGRFTQEDPIGLAGGLNLYGFATGDPVNLGDPFGLCPWCFGSFMDPKLVFDMSSQVAFEALPYEQKRAMVLRMAHSNAEAPILVGSLLTGGGEQRVRSRIGEDAGLVREASRLSGQLQRSIDHLTSELAKGNLNPGIGTKHLIGDIFYARARDGARVFFRQARDGIEILAKAAKDNEDRVIQILKERYR